MPASASQRSWTTLASCRCVVRVRLSWCRCGWTTRHQSSSLPCSKRTLQHARGARLARDRSRRSPAPFAWRTLSHLTTLSFASAAAASVLTIAAITLAGALGRTTQSAAVPLTYLPTVDRVSNADLVELRVLRRAQLHLPGTALNSVHIKSAAILAPCSLRPSRLGVEASTMPPVWRQGSKRRNSPVAASGGVAPRQNRVRSARADLVACCAS